jgi:hypothetical protein
MRDLDLSRPYGTIHPPQTFPRCDRPAAFEQDGILFGTEGREIVAKGAAPAPAPPPAHATPPALRGQHRARHIERLIRDAEKLPLSVLRREAGIVVGASCPVQKAGIVAALQAQLVVHHARLAAGASRVHDEVIELDGVDPAEDTPERPVAEVFPDP